MGLILSSSDRGPTSGPPFVGQVVVQLVGGEAGPLFTDRRGHHTPGRGGVTGRQSWGVAGRYLAHAASWVTEVGPNDDESLGRQVRAVRKLNNPLT
jgi:hypothetical protein